MTRFCGSDVFTSKFDIDDQPKAEVAWLCDGHCYTSLANDWQTSITV